MVLGTLIIGMSVNPGSKIYLFTPVHAVLRTGAFVDIPIILNPNSRHIPRTAVLWRIEGTASFVLLSGVILALQKPLEHSTFIPVQRMGKYT